MPSIEQSFSPKDVLGSSRFQNSTAIPESSGVGIAEKYISTLLQLYGKLSKFADLEPSTEVNAIFEKLVSICAETPNESIAEQILTDPRIIKITPELRKLCSEGECLLEAYWAKRIGSFESESQVNKSLLGFPYYRNYVDLTRMELYALFSLVSTTPRNFAFIGSGPLPLTSLCIASFFEKENNDPSINIRVRIHNIDRDEQAISLSSSLCEKLGDRAKSMTFQCTEAIEKKDQNLHDFDVVYLAALVGNTKAEKRRVISDVAGRMRVGALLVLRSAHSLRSLLYPIIDAATNLQHSNLQPLLCVHPYNHIVNSVVIALVTDTSNGKQ